MKRKKWIGYALLILCLSLVCWVFQGRDAFALRDTDTQSIIAGLNHHPGLGYWWHHDWPLGNHFYRPLSTLLFQFDLGLHAQNDLAWIQTNALLVALAVASFGWFVAELSDSISFSFLCTALFVTWIIGLGANLTPLFWIVALCVFAVGLGRHGLSGRLYLPAVFVWIWVAYECQGIADLFFRSEGWIPGRTATSMTTLAFVSMAAFTRYCRLGPMKNSEPVSTALDLPATKSSVEADNLSPKGRIWWLLLALIALAGALACYEQAVMVPALLGMIALYWHFRHRIMNWATAIPVVGILAAYIAAHLAFVPHEASTYYNWQKQPATMAVRSLQRYFLFPITQFEKLRVVASGGILVWLFIDPWIAAMNFAASITAAWQAQRKGLLCGFGWLGSTLAFLPMAFYKDFSHYHFWPMAIRTIWVVGLGSVAVELTVIAASPRACQSPLRPHPAPGSLLHP